MKTHPTIILCTWTYPTALHYQKDFQKRNARHWQTVPCNLNEEEYKRLPFANNFNDAAAMLLVTPA